MGGSTIAEFAGNSAHRPRNSVGPRWIRNCGIFAQLAIAFALSACQTAPVGIEVREVEVAVPVACITPEQVPAEPPRVGDQLTGNAVVDLSIVAASALELRKWGQEMAALLRGCGG